VLISVSFFFFGKAWENRRKISNFLKKIVRTLQFYPRFSFTQSVAQQRLLENAVISPVL